jgi:hypothetical protein
MASMWPEWEAETLPRLASLSFVCYTEDSVGRVAQR